MIKPDKDGNYTEEQWNELPITYKLRLCAVDEYQIYPSDMIDAAGHIEQLETALRFMIRNEEVNEALAKAAGEPYVNKGLDFARTLVVMEKKDGLP
jgi:hypothetical protein